MKRFLTLSTSLLIVLVACSATTASAKGETGNATWLANWEMKKASLGVIETDPFISEAFGLDTVPLGFFLEDAADRKVASLIEEARQAKLYTNSVRLHKMVAKTSRYIGHTWYALSGATPSGWDCSGLVRWSFDQIGIDLYHSASVQKQSGRIVDTPKYGDLVAFGWKGYRGAQHIGIYLNNGKMLHAGGKPGMRTAIVDIAKWAKGSGNTLITYTRILETK